jgi:hypothetical protein
MAELSERMTCPLCERPIDLGAGDYIALPCVGLTNPRYAPLDDAAVHGSCLKAWRKRDHFVRLFNEALAGAPNPLRRRLVVGASGEVSWADEGRA